MDSEPTVMKFGGTSVQDSEAFLRVAEIVKSEARKCPVVVVSAMSGVTNALLKCVELARRGESELAIGMIQNLIERHREVGTALLKNESAFRTQTQLDQTSAEIKRLLLLFSGREETWLELQDSVVAYGEMLSASLLSEILVVQGLRAQYLDGRNCIVTDERFGRAAPIFDLTYQAIRTNLVPILEMGAIPVLGGFIASSTSGITTTLGRGGSDYTAAIVGAAIRAQQIQIWTDVTGVLTADPRIVSNASTIPNLSFSEAAELAYFGAKVLHPKTIQPAIEHNIPVRICNSKHPELAGTIVFGESASSGKTVKAIAHKTNVTTVQITSARMLGSYGFLNRIFQTFDKHQTVVDVVTTSEVSVSLSLDDTSSLGSIVTDLRDLGHVSIEEGRAIICVVGEGLTNTPGIAGKVFSTLSDINISLISQGASSINLTFAVKEEHVVEVVTRLHEAFFG